MQLLLADHLSAMGKEGSCHRATCEVEIVSLEWSAKANPENVPTSSSSVALRYYSHERGSSSSSSSSSEYDAGLQAIERLQWPAALKQKLRTILSTAQPFQIALTANGAFDILRPTLHHLMWRSPHYDPRNVTSVQGLPRMTPTTAMVYFPEADEAQSFEQARALLGSLFREDEGSRVGDVVPVLSRFDAWSAEAEAAMRAQDDTARAILQLSPDEAGTGFVAAAYADPRRRGISTPETGVYVEGHGAARRQLREAEGDTTLEQWKELEAKLKNGYDVCVDVDCEIRMAADGLISEHCTEPPEAVAAMCTREIANRTHSAAGKKGAMTDLDLSRDIKVRDTMNGYTAVAPAAHEHDTPHPSP